jgi:hypothetical protein
VFKLTSCAEENRLRYGKHRRREVFWEGGLRVNSKLSLCIVKLLIADSIRRDIIQESRDELVQNTFSASNDC